MALTHGHCDRDWRGFYYLSPYGMAVKHGFQGTEEEWLASLKGDTGDAFTYDMFTPEQLSALTGPQGEKGDTGDTGPQGEPGERGADGNPGVFIGSGDPPEGYTVQVDPEGDGTVEDSEEIFIATYNETTYDQIKEAYDAGKLVYCFYDNMVYILFTATEQEAAVLTSLLGTTMKLLVVLGDRWIVVNDIDIENTANKVTSLSGDSTDDQYPSAKAVYDAIQTAITDTWEASY